MNSSRSGKDAGNKILFFCGTLQGAGIGTYAVIGPVLPDTEGLAGIFSGKVDYVIIGRMNFHYADWVYRKYGLEEYFADD